MAQIVVGLIAEGDTDYRFLEPVIENTLMGIVFDCRGQIEVFVKAIKCEKGDSFTDYVLNASQKGYEEYGITMLVVHTDADNISSANAYQNKINPARTLLQNQTDDARCKSMVALVPVRETESWMLADKDILIGQIGTRKGLVELNIAGNPETFNNPKERIEEAIRIGRAEMPKKLRNSLRISDLYSYIGQTIQIEKLQTFDSFVDFENNIKDALIDLNFLDPRRR